MSWLAVFYLILILGLCGVMIKASDILLINIQALARKTRWKTFALAGLIVGVGTSLPELFVGLTSAIEARPVLSLGNIVGANLANVSLVIGGAALLGGAVKVEGLFLRRDIFYVFLASALPMILLVDRQMTRLDGVVLISSFIFYEFVILSEGREKAQLGDQGGWLRKIIRQLADRKTEKEIGWIMLAIALLLFAGDAIVKLASQLATALDLPLLLIGMSLVALGTTIPELAFELNAIRQHQPSMVFGNLMGSVVANGTLIIGLVALISPFRLASFPQYLLATIALVLIFGLFYLFVRSKSRLDRWEGGVLLIAYIIFIALELIR